MLKYGIDDVDTLLACAYQTLRCLQRIVSGHAGAALLSQQRTSGAASKYYAAGEAQSLHQVRWSDAVIVP